VTLRRFGIDTTFVQGSDPADYAAAITDKTKLIFAETVANPSGEIADIEGPFWIWLAVLLAFAALCVGTYLWFRTHPSPEEDAAETESENERPDGAVLEDARA
jgi:hypothetical protein